MFFVNEDKTNYVSVGYYPARDYQPLMEFGAIRRGGSKCLILADEQVAALEDCLPSIRDSMCVGGDRVVIKCESGNFRLHTPKRHGCARLFVGTALSGTFLSESNSNPTPPSKVCGRLILQQHVNFGGPRLRTSYVEGESIRV